MNSTTMDNANPIIHSTSSTSSKRLKSTAFLDLDLQDQDEWESLQHKLGYGGQVDTASYAADSVDEIDQDEIFGTLLSSPLLSSLPKSGCVSPFSPPTSAHMDA